MGIGAPGIEQFRDAIVEFRNRHIIAAVKPLIDMRMELTGNDEFKQRGGIDNTTQRHLIVLLQACDKWRRMVTYNPDGQDLDKLVAQAIDPSNLIGGSPTTGASPDTPLKTGLAPFTADEVQAAAGTLRQLPWALDGSDVNLPLNSKLNFRNGDGFLLLQAIDEAIVTWTRLESRNASRFITVMDSMRMYQQYVQILEYLKIFGGDQNRVDFAAGVLPSEEPRGVGNSPNMAGEVAGTSGVVASENTVVK